MKRRAFLAGLICAPVAAALASIQTRRLIVMNGISGLSADGRMTSKITVRDRGAYWDTVSIEMIELAPRTPWSC